MSGVDNNYDEYEVNDPDSSASDSEDGFNHDVRQYNQLLCTLTIVYMNQDSSEVWDTDHSIEDIDISEDDFVVGEDSRIDEQTLKFCSTISIFVLTWQYRFHLSDAAVSALATSFLYCLPKNAQYRSPVKGYIVHAHISA